MEMFLLNHPGTSLALPILAVGVSVGQSEFSYQGTDQGATFGLVLECVF